MPPRVRLSFAAMMGVVFLIPAVALYSELTRRADIWWTPRPLLVPLAESQARVEVYVRGKSLGSLLEAGQLRLADAAATDVLASADVGFRFNNVDRVRAQRVPLLLGYAAVCGAGATLLLLLLTGRLAYRDEKEPVAG